ncbi:MAG: hypothetical protein QM730_19125 [Anaerolineales bacterium]
MSESNDKSTGSDILLTDPKFVMQIWFKYNNKDFMQTIAHEAKQEIFVIEQFVKVFLDDFEFVNEQVKSLWGERKVEENVAVIMKELAKLRQIMSIVWEYSESHLLSDTSNSKF